jgi:hypothetical protein
MKRSFAIVSIMGTLLISASAFAAQPPTTPPAYGSVPGQIQAGIVGAQCGSGAGSGAFNYFGPGNNMAGGANGVQTGLNNSAVCGNRQGNLP